MKKLISIGECMLELSSVKDDIWKMGIAGDTLNTSWYARACLSKNWSVLFATKIGKDVMSSKVINFRCVVCFFGSSLQNAHKKPSFQPRKPWSTQFHFKSIHLSNLYE